MDSLPNSLRKLEAKARNELQLLHELGAEHFSNADLLRLKGQWEVLHRQSDYLNRGLIWLAASAPAWAVLSALFAIIGWQALAGFTIKLFPISFLLFLLGLSAKIWCIGTSSFLESVGEAIDMELRLRAERRKRV
jgi:hypothetical protein